MAKIYRLSDRIKLKIDDLIVIISPLSIHQKASVEEVASSAGLIKGTIEAIRYSVKDISGLKDSEGNDYELQYDENGNLSDESLNDLFNIEQSFKLSAVALNLVNSVPEVFSDPNTGKPLQGVEFIQSEEKAPRKKKRVVSGK